MRNKNIKSYKKKNGTTAYRFKAYLGTDPVTGKRVETTRRGFKSAREAQRALDRLRVDYDSGGWHNDYEIKTFDDLFQEWINIKSGNIKSTTLEHYKDLYYRTFQPTIGKVKLEKITPALLQRLFSKIAKTHSTIKNYAAIIKPALNYAVNMDLIKKNPLNQIIMPKGQESPFKGTINFYNRQELASFLNSVEKLGDLKIYCFFRLLAYTGMRRGEALSLTWSDLNIAKETVHISKTCVYNRDLKRQTTQPPKTEASIRTVSLDKQTISILQHWHLEQSKLKMMNGFRNRDNEQYIFANNKNQLANPDTPSQWLARVYRHYPQKKIRVHGFRHTHASLLFEAGASVKEVQERLGHESSATTMNVYNHVMKARSSETGNKFAKYMEL